MTALPSSKNNQKYQSIAVGYRTDVSSHMLPLLIVNIYAVYNEIETPSSTDNRELQRLESINASNDRLSINRSDLLVQVPSIDRKISNSNHTTQQRSWNTDQLFTMFYASSHSGTQVRRFRLKTEEGTAKAQEHGGYSRNHG